MAIEKKTENGKEDEGMMQEKETMAKCFPLIVKNPCCNSFANFNYSKIQRYKYYLYCDCRIEKE